MSASQGARGVRSWRHLRACEDWKPSRSARLMSATLAEWDLGSGEGILNEEQYSYSILACAE